MASYRSHSGRLVVSDNDGGWVATIKTGLETIKITLESTTPGNAIIEGEHLYADARAVTNSKPCCWRCVHWLPVKSECGLGFPEGRRSGGRFASKCSCFWAD